MSNQALSVIEPPGGEHKLSQQILQQWEEVPQPQLIQEGETACQEQKAEQHLEVRSQWLVRINVYCAEVFWIQGK